MKKKKQLKLRKTKVSKLNELTKIMGGSSEICDPTITDLETNTSQQKGTTIVGYTD